MNLLNQLLDSLIQDQARPKEITDMLDRLVPREFIKGEPTTRKEAT